MPKIKICGLRDKENIRDISLLSVDYLGFIFYSKSPRYVGAELDADFLLKLPDTTHKVGVFVNESNEKLLAIRRKYELDLLQLHGEESPEQCQELKTAGCSIIKAFPVDESFDFESLKAYNTSVDYFLFDTRTGKYGGSGKKFNWQLLESYNGKTPFFLSGGIGPGDVKAIQEFQHPFLHALDLNSGFEDWPAQKNAKKLECFLKAI